MHKEGCNMTAWMIRAGRGGVYAQSWLETATIGIGWDFGGADLARMPKGRIREAYVAAHPGESKGKVSAAVSQVYKFAHDMAEGSTVVMYDPETRLYHLGTVTGPCTPTTQDGATYVRTVSWQGQAQRDALSTASKNSLGGISTIFSVSDEALADLRRAAVKPSEAPVAPADQDDEGTEEEARYATFDNGIERIKDRLLAVHPDDMEQLTAGLLRAMGYHARVTPKGPDGGRDVIASPDALGLEVPRIICEVKHRKGSMGALQLRAFIGGLRGGDRGLYVSTGGFTKEARYEADRSNVPVRLLDLDGFARLYADFYDRTDEDARAILPLVRIWWPA
ncbi:restriction endonuclease [Tractidigestivibacter scatoligenes]|nr:restriction endonuclease [Tractidigestivibacter scatoligenes]